MGSGFRFSGATLARARFYHGPYAATSVHGPAASSPQSPRARSRPKAWQNSQRLESPRDPQLNATYATRRVCSSRVALHARHATPPASRQDNCFEVCYGGVAWYCAIRSTNDDIEARNALVASSPPLYDPWSSGLIFLPRETVTVQPVGDMLWEGIVHYGTVPQTGESVFAFDTDGVTQHITQSLATVARYAPPGRRAPDCKRAIGVTADSVGGVEITVPVYHIARRIIRPTRWPRSRRS